MVARQYDMASARGFVTLPISAIIQAANLFCCDIYIKSEQRKFNVKCYDELQTGIQPQRRQLVFYFDGADEREADVKFRRMFGA